MSIKGEGHSLTLVKGHSDFIVKCLTFGLYTQVSDSGPHGPLVLKWQDSANIRSDCREPWFLLTSLMLCGSMLLLECKLH